MISILLTDGTVGQITESSIDFQNPEIFIGERMQVALSDENGNPIEIEGVVQEIL